MPVIALCKGFKPRVDHTLYGSPADKGMGEAAFPAGRREKIIQRLVEAEPGERPLRLPLPECVINVGMRGFPEHVLYGRNHLQAAVCKNNRFIRLAGGVSDRNL